MEKLLYLLHLWLLLTQEKIIGFGGATEKGQ